MLHNMAPVAQRTTYPTLLGTNEVFVAPSVVSESEQAALVDWMEEQLGREQFSQNPLDPHMHVSPFYAVDGGPTLFARHPNRLPAHIWTPSFGSAALPPACWNIRNRVLAWLELEGLRDDPYKGTFLTHIARNGEVATHRDFRLQVEGETYLILRCNVLLQRPEVGGMPVISRRELDIAERGCWVFFPTELVHSATPVQGSRARATLSFGVLVTPAQLRDRCFRQSWSGDFVATSVGAQRVVDFILASPNEVFSVHDVATALGRAPRDIWPAIIRLQRAGCIESESALNARHGHVISL